MAMLYHIEYDVKLQQLVFTLPHLKVVILPKIVFEKYLSYFFTKDKKQ